MNILIKIVLRLIISIVLPMTALVACYPNKAPSTTTLHPTSLVLTAVVPTAPNPMLTRTMTATQEAIPSLTTTATNVPTTKIPIFPYASYYNPLLPGQYVVFSPGIEDVSYGVVSLDGKFQRELVTGVDTALGAFTRDGKSLVFFDIKQNEFIIYDLTDTTVIKISSTRTCYRLDWSPDELEIVAECAGEMTAISLENGQPVLLASGLGLSTSSGENPHWSPDGQWIAFIFWGDGRSDPRNGIYVMAVDCLKGLTSCIEETKGPFLGPAGNFDNASSMTWSPDSQHIAVMNYRDNIIQVVDVQDGTARTIVSHDTFDGLSGLAWSPDGNWIAFGVPAINGQLIFGVYLISPQGGTPLLLGQEIGDVIDWIIIPHPFAQGDTYTITEAGADINFRADPSLDGEVLRKLQPGDLVTILEGPMDADGYTWWQMQAEDGTMGWAVNIPEWYAPVSEEAMATPTP